MTVAVVSTRGVQKGVITTSHRCDDKAKDKGKDIHQQISITAVVAMAVAIVMAVVTKVIHNMRVKVNDRASTSDLKTTTRSTVITHTPPPAETHLMR